MIPVKKIIVISLFLLNIFSFAPQVFAVPDEGAGDGVISDLAAAQADAAAKMQRAGDARDFADQKRRIADEADRALEFAREELRAAQQNRVNRGPDADARVYTAQDAVDVAQARATEAHIQLSAADNAATIASGLSTDAWALVRELKAKQVEEEHQERATCLCSDGDPNAPLTEHDGLAEDTCVDRPDLANGALFNCQWVAHLKDAEPIIQENIKDLQEKFKNDPNANPLMAYRNDIKGLNKLQGGTVQGFLGLVIKTATGIMGTVALAMIIYGGLLWMTSNGNSSQVDKAQKVIIWAALGLLVIFASYAIITFIFEAFNPNITDTSS